MLQSVPVQQPQPSHTRSHYCQPSGTCRCVQVQAAASHFTRSCSSSEVAKFWLVYWNPLVTQISCGAPVRSESLAIRDLLAELRYTILEVPASTALRCLLGTGHRWRKKSVFKARKWHCGRYTEIGESVHRAGNPKYHLTQEKY